MPTLFLDNVSDDLYRRLERLAGAHRRPVAEEAIRLLQDAVSRHKNGAHSTEPGPSQQALLEQIVRGRYAPAPGTPESVDLLREDRDR